MEKKGFTKEESLALKAVAVLLLIMYHSLKGSDYEGFTLNFFPLTESQVNHIGIYCKICVGIFAFISGYGISKKYRDSEKTISQKAFSQYISSIKEFWPVFIICILATAAIDGRPVTVYAGQTLCHSAVNLLLDGLGLAKLMGTPTLEDSWWYLSAMTVFTFATPLFQKAVRRTGWLVPLFGLIAFPRLIGMGYLDGASVQPFYYLMAVLLGIIFAEHDLFERLDDIRILKGGGELLNRALRLAAATVALLISNKVFYLLPREAFWEYHNAIAPLAFILCFREWICVLPVLKRVLTCLGRHSGNIFFVQGLLLRYYLREFLFTKPWFMLTPLATYAVSLVLSMVLEAGKSGVISRISGKCDFRFQIHPDTSWTRKQRNGFWAWNLFWVLVSGFALGVLSLLLATGPDNIDIEKSLLQSPTIVALNTLPVVLLNLIVYALTRRAWLAFSINSVFVLSLSLIDYFKIKIRDDPLIFSDLILVKEVGNIAGKYNLSLDYRLSAVLICVLAVVVFLFFLVRGRPKKVSRLAFAMFFSGIAGLSLLTPVLMDEGIYREINEWTWAPTRHYISHGFVYPFVHSISDISESPPPGYNAEDTAALLGAYPEADIPDERKVNVIAVMLEAYNDFSRFNVPGLKADVYQTWHDLEQEGYSGILVANTFGGGTYRTERSFLTGYLDSYNFRGNVNAYPWYFRSQGYRVEGFHPYHRWYYNRENVNQYLGFENFYFVNDVESFAEDPWFSNEAFFAEIQKAYEDSKAAGEPYFNFSLSMEGHGPYDDINYELAERGSHVLDDGIYTDEQQYLLENYFMTIASTNESLRKFTDFLRADTEPVVLVLFGDHNPSIGGDAYSAMGIDIDTSTEEGFRNYYSTRYIIWANDAAKGVLENDFSGEGPEIGPYFLMNQVFELCGWNGPAYLQALQDISEQVQVVHTSGVCMKNGEFISESDADANNAAAAFRSLEYFQRKRSFEDVYD